MNQGFTSELLAVMPAVLATGLLSALCTIQRQNGTYSDSGQPDLTETGFANLPGHINLACMSAVPSVARVQATEVKQLRDILAKQFRHTLLKGYYPDIEQDDIAVITLVGPSAPAPIRFDILGVESDSQQNMTRLELELATI